MPIIIILQKYGRARSGGRAFRYYSGTGSSQSFTGVAAAIPHANALYYILQPPNNGNNNKKSSKGRLSQDDGPDK
ncbi:MAG: hypothetical protein ABI091_03745 [Ferruginibacter sp.]